MPTAYVKFRSGGGYQQVEDYDYVLDYRKLMENGYYRDSGFLPLALPNETTNLDVATEASLVTIGTGQVYPESGTYFRFSSLSNVNLHVRSPDEMTHTGPRQLSWYDTTLTFLADSGVTATATASDSSSRTLITVADSSLFSGKIVAFSGSDIPSALYPNQLYYAVAVSATTLLLQEVVGGAYVAWGDAGTGTTTIRVVDKIAEFPWPNILGWSNTAPTR